MGIRRPHRLALWQRQLPSVGAQHQRHQEGTLELPWRPRDCHLDTIVLVSFSEHQPQPRLHRLHGYYETPKCEHCCASAIVHSCFVRQASFDLVQRTQPRSSPSRLSTPPASTFWQRSQALQSLYGPSQCISIQICSRSCSSICIRVCSRSCSAKRLACRPQRKT